MKHPKPQPICKTCGLPITKSANTKLGMSKFCSMNCYATFQRNKKILESRKAPQTNIEVTRLSKKRFGKYKPITEPVRGRPVEKEVSGRDEDYKAFVREHKCATCGSKAVEFAHIGTGGMGTKASDYLGVPLCAVCHRIGVNSLHNVGLARFQRHYKVDIKDVQVKLLSEYVRRIKNDTSD